MNYGVIDSAQKVSQQELDKVFKYCHQHAIDMFDTAPSYGDAEIVLGQAGCANYANIVTKAGKISADIINNVAVEQLQNTFEASLKALQTDSVYGLLVHDVKDLSKPGAEYLLEWLFAQKGHGLVSKVGVSVYSPEEARVLFDQYNFDLIQIPYNLFDQRFRLSGTLDWLQAKKVEVHARSLFLKGILLKNEIPDSLPTGLKEHHQAFRTSIQQQNISAYDACLLFAEQNKQIDRWVIGVSTEQQLEKLLDWKKSDVKEIDVNRWSLGDNKLIDPRFW